jgi:hypothetical protein
MAPLTYEYSGVCYTATSGQTIFALTSTAGNPIGYLSPTHIHVRTSVDSGTTWNTLPAGTGWTFANPATSIVLTTPATAGEWIDIQRKTPINTDWVDFQSGSLLTAEQLNEAETFSLYCDQELADGVVDLTPPDIGLDSTDDLPEGSVNLYYTNARVESYVSGAGYLKNLSGLDTDDLSEGSSNLYYTNERVESYVSGAGYIKDAGVTRLIAGANIGLSPSNGTGEVTITAAGGGGGTGGIPEAPINGETFGRKNAAWISLSLDLPVQSDWNVTDSLSLAFIKNKPSWTQSDWAVTDSSSFAFIENKPDLDLQATCDRGNVTTTTIQAAGYRIDQLDFLPS